MNNQKRLLLIGNGLTIDLRKNFPELPDPAAPLTWNIPWGNKPFIDVLPNFKERVLKIKEEYPDISDFDLFNKISSSDLKDKDKEARIEARHHLAVAYSQLQQQINLLDIKRWKWLEKISGLQHEIKAAVSFNYDLLFETIEPVKKIV